MAKNLLITGGLGFIGSNAAVYFHKKGWNVTVADNYSRMPGSKLNHKWLQEKYPDIIVQKLDVCSDKKKLKILIGETDVVLHAAGQVAVTLSVQDPVSDFNNNLLGTLNVLEAVRLSANKPAIIYTSTNKVYGESAYIPVKKTEKGYRYASLPNGISEENKLNFHSPYGCSKGSADQYVLDYGRIYGLRTVVFRQSCIYGPRQFGSEDQGWVAWFAIRSALRMPVTIYGDGYQSRDILHVDDLNRAYECAIRNISKLKGSVYNMGGGAGNQLSVNGLIKKLDTLNKSKLKVSYSGWRPGDQKVFVCDVAKAGRELGWKPKIGVDEGVESIVEWIKDNRKTFEKMYKK